MARIGSKDQEKIKELGAQLQRDVEVDLFTQRQSPLFVPGVIPCETCALTEEVVAELQTLVPRLKVTTHDIVGEAELARSRGIDRVPTLAFGDGLAGRVSFVGAPLGFEFASFLTGVLEAGGSTKSVSDAATEKLSALTQPVHLKVFVTPT